ncbi:MAG: hypothetical protein K2K13_06985 [Clostridiales bacterium]|nr:hypothetical protein [Clostridiales bacterium]
MEKCSQCKHFERYYTKGVKRFSKTEFGLCTQKHESVNIHDCCERYKAGVRYRGIISKRVKVCLNELLTEISAIRMVIEEEADGKLQK